MSFQTKQTSEETLEGNLDDSSYQDISTPSEIIQIYMWGGQLKKKSGCHEEECGQESWEWGEAVRHTGLESHDGAWKDKKRSDDGGRGEGQA